MRKEGKMRKSLLAELKEKCPTILDFLLHIAPNSCHTVQLGTPESGLFLVNFWDFDLMISYLWHMIRGDKWNYPVLLLTGPRCSGKTIFFEFLHDLLVDKVYICNLLPEPLYYFKSRPVLCFDSMCAKDVYLVMEALQEQGITTDKVLINTNDTFDPINESKIDYPYWRLRLSALDPEHCNRDLRPLMREEMAAFQEILLQIPLRETYGFAKQMPWTTAHHIKKGGKV